MSNASSDTELTGSGSHVLGMEDAAVVIGYLLSCLAVGLWAACRTSRDSVAGYFLAGRDIRWFAVGASIFCVDLGTRAILGTAGAGAASGISVACYGLNAIICVLLQAWVFVPVYIAAGVYTLPEYLRKRFGGRRLQLYMAVLSLLLCVFTKLAPDVYAGAVFVQQFLGWNMYLGVSVILAVSTVYAVLGGLKSAMYTQTLQTGVLLVGCIALSVLSFQRVEGFSGLKSRYMQAVPSVRPNNTTCGQPASEAFHLLNSAVSGAIPWPGNVLGIPLLAAWYFCTDQVMVQRSLAAKNMMHVKGGAILASYLKLLPLFLIIMPGMVSRVLFTEEVACVDPAVCQAVCGNPAGCSNIAYPRLVLELLPTGARGLMMAAMMAFLMTSVTSVFNSASTVFSIDLWLRLRPAATDAELLVVGRLFVLVLVAVSVLWLPVLAGAQGGQLFSYIQAVVSYVAPPVLAAFLLALLWPRTNEPGAFWGLMVGLVAGVCRAVLEFSYPGPVCGETDTRPAVLARLHFLHFALLLFALSAGTTVVVSLLTPPVDGKHLFRLTWRTRHSQERRVSFEDEHTDGYSHNPTEGAGESAESAESTQTSDTPCWYRALRVLCGLEKRTPGASHASHLQQRLREFTSIKEDPTWAKFVNVNATAVLIVTAFIWGYFA